MLVGIDASRIVLKSLTGTEYYSLNLIKSLAKIDKKNSYRLYFNQSFQKKFINQRNFIDKTISFPRFWTQFRLALECLLDPPEILFVPAHTMPIIRRPGLKTIVTVHDLGAEYLAQYHQFPQRLYLNRSTEFVAKHATHLIAVSQSTKKDLEKGFRVSPDRVSVIYEGVDHQKFHPIENKEEINQVKNKYGIKKDFILFVGTIQPRKNLVNLIKAYFDLKGRLKDKTPDLVLVGKRGWLLDEIYQTPKDLGLEKDIKFLDYVSEVDLPALYTGALFFILPSFYEGFGLPLLEAMACECPVLASSSSSLPEVVGDSEVLFNPYKISDISDLMHRMIKNPSLRKTKAKRGFLRSKEFTWEKCAQETLEVFERVYQSK